MEERYFSSLYKRFGGIAHHFTHYPNLMLRSKTRNYWIPCFFLLSIQVAGADYYWVGGSGNWSDISHWVTSSGGSIQHDQVPTANDNVTFDDNSFTAPGQTITADVDILFCRNLDWTNVTFSPSFEAPNRSTLHIFGSLQLSPDMNYDFQGDLQFRGNDSDLEISMGSHAVKRDIYFNNFSGKWSLNQPLRVDSVIIFIAGALSTNGFSLSCHRFISDGTQTRRLNLGSSVISILASTRRNPLSPWIVDHPLSLSSNNLNIDPGTSSIEMIGPNSNIFANGTGAVELGHIKFSATRGRSGLLKDPNNPRAVIKAVSVQFGSNGVLMGDNEIHELTISGGKSYRLASGYQQTINLLNAPGSCQKAIVLIASNSGESAKIRSSIDQTFQFLTIRDIAVIGGASFTLSDAIDLGNNTGWNLTARVPRTLYWVGSGGNWNDNNHWSLNDGGTGGECPPTAIDDVNFTANSFNTNDQVWIDVEDVLCHDMRWKGLATRPVLDGIKGSLRILGSLEWHENLQLQYGGEIRMEGREEGLTITSNGVKFPQHLFINGPGSWSLNDQLTIDDSLLINRGTFSTNDQTIKTDFFISETRLPRSIHLGASEIILTDGDHAGWPEWRIHTENLAFDAGTSHIRDQSSFQSFFTRGDAEITYHDLTFEPTAYEAGLSADYNQRIHFHRVDYGPNGSISGRFFIDSLFLHPNRHYRLSDGDTLTVSHLDANGLCDGLINIHSLYGTSHIEQLSGDLTVNYTVLKDITAVGQATFTAHASTDLGQNRNWIFRDPDHTDRYWVGGSGRWNDISHWSTTSGGAGGACVPTPYNNVYFDANSFTGAGQSVEVVDEDAYCRNMIWRDVPAPHFSVYHDLWVYGGMTLHPSLTLEDYTEVYFVTDSLDQKINLAGKHLGAVFFSGTGSWNLVDSFYVNYQTWFISGDFHSRGHKINIWQYWISDTDSDETQSLIDIDSSHVVVRRDINFSGSWFVNLNSHQISATGSLMEFPARSARMFHSDPQRTGKGPLYNEVIFSNPQGKAYIEQDNYAAPSMTFTKVHFHGDGVVQGSHDFDSLILSPGKSYFLASDLEQRIMQHLQIRGNNCAPINLSSTVPGQKSTIKMERGQVDGDFIQMQDQIATGGASFFAGTNSTDIANSNSGWIFQHSPDYTEFGLLGDDQVLCSGKSIILSAYSFTPSETYRWSTGSTDDHLEIRNPGTYDVQVTFGDNCILKDTVSIVGLQDFRPDLGPDTVLCEGQELVLDASLSASGVSYYWQDQTTDPTFDVNRPGRYHVLLELSGCQAKDTIDVSFVSAAELDLRDEITICEGGSYELNADLGTTSATYLWSDRSSMPSLMVGQPGLYWVEVTANHCTIRDSVVISTIPQPAQFLPVSVSICDGESSTLDGTYPDASYLWSDSSRAAILPVDSPGVYWLQLAVDQCIAIDSTLVEERPSPTLELGRDTLICPGEDLTLEVSSTGLQLVWSNGDTTNSHKVTNSGAVWVAATQNGCTTYDTILVSYHPALSIDLGPDSTICEVDQLELDAGSSAEATYRWNTGSTDQRILVDIAGLYFVEVDDGVCAIRDSITIETRNCLFYKAYAPNGFTPNGDAINDQWIVHFPDNLIVHSYDLKIFNRWGSVIFHSTDHTHAWDGMVDDQKSSTGVYVYQLEISYVDDHGPGSAQESGTITVVR